MNKFLPYNKIIVAGHRGLKSLYPENTKVSFLSAIEAGVDMIETDLRITKDKRIIIMHDDKVDRTTNGTGFIREKCIDEIKLLDAGVKFNAKYKGEQVLTLEEFCDIVAPYHNLLLNIEIKDVNKESADIALNILRERLLTGRCVFTSFSGEMVAYLHDVYGVRTQGFTKQNFHTFTDGDEGTYSKMYAVGMAVKEVTKNLVSDFISKGIRPWVWCPDTEDEVKYCINCGVELMTCNDVGPALKVCRAMGLHN